ncbi:helix-turn-helix transcriptional regulator [Tsukamurella ocularis]|uniref:helix-turn-helix transcriptional regulator n=1 Tax=Tsukamurella ocularis TaxID=1970234 RepID=UPI0039F06743
MRADRLVSLVLLLRRRGRMTADELAAELEVSPRTVQRDIDALSTAGVPVYADRGRRGGYSLLPGFRTELTGLNHDEALALLTAGSGTGRRAFGLNAALASAMRKVVDALPEESRSDLDRAAARFLVEPETDLLSRRSVAEDVDASVMGAVRRAVLAGRVLRFQYAAPEKEPRWHTVDPIGLVTVRDRTYLLAAKAGEDRTYRMSRMLAAEALADAAVRPPQVDLDRIWAERSAQFLSENHIPVLVRVEAARRDELVNHARAVRAEVVEPDGRVRLDVCFEDLRHAVWAVWQLDTAAEALAPEELRAALRARAEGVADRYRIT